MKQNEEATPTIIEVGDDYSLTVTDSGNLQQFFADGENLQKVADRIETLARGLLADVSTKEGVSQIKTAARQIASVKKKVDDLGKTVVAELKALPKIIDKNRADFRERMESLQEEIRRPVTDIEERQKAIDDIKGTHFACAACNSQELAAKIEELETQRAAVTAEVWKEAYEEVLKAFDAEIGALSTMKSAAEKREEMAQEPAPAVHAAPAQKPSKWTPEMKAINNDIVKAIAAIIAERLQGFTANGYELAAREIVKAIVNNKINHLSVSY